MIFNVMLSNCSMYRSVFNVFLKSLVSLIFLMSSEKEFQRFGACNDSALLDVVHLVLEYSFGMNNTFYHLFSSADFQDIFLLDP